MSCPLVNRSVFKSLSYDEMFRWIPCSTCRGRMIWWHYWSRKNARKCSRTWNRNFCQGRAIWMTPETGIPVCDVMFGHLFCQWQNTLQWQAVLSAAVQAGGSNCVQLLCISWRLAHGPAVTCVTCLCCIRHPLPGMQQPAPYPSAGRGGGWYVCAGQLTMEIVIYNQIVTV